MRNSKMASSFLSDNLHMKFPKTVEGSQKMYDEWATNYDSQLMQQGYNAPAACEKALQKWVSDKNVRIMDIACGTGLVGELLVKAGYATIDGLDISAESIRVCRQKNIYGKLFCSDVNSNEVGNDTYDVTVCVGCFGPGHMDELCFPQLVRMTKPGGFLVITMREYYFDTSKDFNRGGKFEAAIQNMSQQGKWQELSRDPVDGYYGNYKGLTLVFKIL